MRRSIALGLLFLTPILPAIGASDAVEQADVLKRTEELELQLQSVKNKFDTLRLNLVKSNARNEELATRTSRQRDDIDQLSRNIRELGVTLSTLESLTAKDRANLLKVEEQAAEGRKSLKDGLDSANSDLADVKHDLGNTLKELQKRADDLGHQLDREVRRVEGDLGHAETKLGMLAVVLFVGVCAGAYGSWLLGRRIGANKTQLTTQIDDVQRSTRDEGLRLDNKLLEVMEKQLQLLSKKRQSPGSDGELDHSLALRVADELVRLDKNFSRMNEDTRGLKQLKASATRIKDTLETNGYEVVSLLGQRFDSGMKLLATFREDDTLAEGQELISRVIKPQVNFSGQMIQAAQVEVSQGTKVGR